MDDSALAPAERALLDVLQRRGVRFMIVGMSAALLQGARGATEDINLWLESTDDQRLDDAAREVGGFWMTGFGMRPPGFAGEALGDRFDVVTHVHGVGSFDEEYAGATVVDLDGLAVRVLPLRRILRSKQALGRPRDKAQMPALEEALAAIDDEAQMKPK